MNNTQHAIDALYTQQQTAKEYGFMWDNLFQLVDHVRSECDEIEEALRSGNAVEIADEIGDLIRGAVTLCCLAGLDATELLKKGNDKFQKRYDTVLELVEQDGLPDLKQSSFDEKMAYWRRAKSQCSP